MEINLVKRVARSLFRASTAIPLGALLLTFGCAPGPGVGTETGFGCSNPKLCFCELSHQPELSLVLAEVKTVAPDGSAELEVLEVVALAENDTTSVGDLVTVRPFMSVEQADVIFVRLAPVVEPAAMVRITDGDRAYCADDPDHVGPNIARDDLVALATSGSDFACGRQVDDVEIADLPEPGECNDAAEP